MDFGDYAYKKIDPPSKSIYLPGGFISKHLYHTHTEPVIAHVAAYI
jgi:hypothetical protein